MSRNEAIQEAEGMLATAGLRRTKQRLAILSILLTAKRPITQDQITVGLKNAPNKATIYRVMESFIKAGIVHKAFLQEKTWHFELAHNCSKKQCHPHFTCTNCGCTHCLTDLKMPMAKCNDEGFIITHQRIQLEGICPNCSIKNTV